MKHRTKEIIEYLLCIAVFSLCIGVSVLFACRKSGYFVDEIYSYGLSNSYYAPYISDIKGRNIEEQTLSRDELLEYLTAGEEDAFAAGSVYFNQGCDVHPPLYYWLFNFISSLFFRGSFSKWTGLSLNIFAFAGTLLALYFLSLELFGSKTSACVSMAVYGLSVLGLSAVMMIRMYALLSFFTVLLALSAVKVLKDPSRKSNYVLLFFALFFGMMTQYYFVFYAFFLCLFCIIVLLVKKDCRHAAVFSISALAGVAAMILLFPASLKHIFVGNGQVVGGQSVLESIRDTSAYGKHIDIYKSCRNGLGGLRQSLLLTGIVFVALLLAWLIKNRGQITKTYFAGKLKAFPFHALLVIIPAQIAFVCVAVMAPVQELRYIYNLVPIFAISVSLLFTLSAKLSSSLLPEKKSFPIEFSIVAAIILLSLFSAKRLPPEHLYPEQKNYNEIVSAHSADPCIYLTDGYISPITQDAPQLLCFNSVFITGNPSSEKISEYIGDADEVIVYVDVNKFWTKGFDPDAAINEIMQANGFTDSALLYRYCYSIYDGLSETYIISR